MKNSVLTGSIAFAGLLGVAAVAGHHAFAQPAPAQPAAAPLTAAQLPPPGTCPAAGGRGAGRGGAAADANTARPKRVLAWADSRNGRAQHEYVSYALGQMQRMGHESKAYDVIIRTDSDIISFNAKMLDGKTPASGGPNLCNIDGIIFANHRTMPLDPQQKADLISALKDRGIGFVVLFTGMLPIDDFPEIQKIQGQKPALVDVHDPWPAPSTFINEAPDSPITKHYPKTFNADVAVYQPDFYSRGEIQVLLRKDLSKLPANYKYTRTDGDYPVAYIKNYGKSRVFVTSLGGNAPASWDDKDMLKMFDEAIKWSVGLTNYEVKPHPLPADARPPIGPVPPPPPPGAGRGGRGPAPAGG